LFQFAKNLKFLKKREKFGGFFFTDRGGFNCSAYQHPRRDDKYKYTVAGEKKLYKIFVFKACIYF
jgi:hypothetical protein